MESGKRRKRKGTGALFRLLWVGLRRARLDFLSFRTDERGVIALIFAVSLIPILLSIGVSFDYSRAITARTNIQQAADAAALALVPTAGSLTAANLNSQASAYLTAASQDSNAVITSATYNTTTGQLCINAQTLILTFFMKLGNINSVTVSAHSCSMVGGQSFEVAMVLDNTGSMATVDITTGQSKLQNAVTAAKKMLTTIFAGQSTSSSYQVSIVPFSSSVKVGTQYNNQPWVDTNGKSSIHFENVPLPPSSQGPKWTPQSRFELFNRVGVSWGGCFEQRPQPYSLTDTAPTISIPDTLFVPLFAPDEGDPSYSGWRCTSSCNANNYLNDNGGFCSTSPDGSISNNRDNPFTFNDGKTLWNTGFAKYCKYKNQSANLYFADGPNSGCEANLTPMQLLTNVQSDLTSTLNAMNAVGDTNLVSGLMWGWRAISPNGPFSALSSPKAYNYTSPSGVVNNKVIVFMTDGTNHWSPAASSLSDVDSDYMDLGYYNNARLGKLPVTINGVTTNAWPNASNYRYYLDSAFLQACTNAKATGIQIYTIGFSIPNDPIDQQGLTVLQQCASKTSMAYVATSGTQAIDIFSTIANQLTGARLTD